MFTGLKKDSAFKRLRRPKFQIVPPSRPKAPDETPTEYDRLKRLLKDDKLVKRIMRFMEKFPQATTPEAITYLWLEDNGHKFFFQLEMFGGRRRSGGIVADFVVPVHGGSAYIFAVQGEYWHTMLQKHMSDERANILPIGQTLFGYRIEKVIELWENDIYHKRPQVFHLAMAGIEMRA